MGRKGAKRALAGAFGRAVGWRSALNFWPQAQAQNTRWRTRAREDEGRRGESGKGCEGGARKGCRERGDDIHFCVWRRRPKKLENPSITMLPGIAARCLHSAGVVPPALPPAIRVSASCAK